MKAVTRFTLTILVALSFNLGQINAQQTEVYADANNDLNIDTSQFDEDSDYNSLPQHNAVNDIDFTDVEQRIQTATPDDAAIFDMDMPNISRTIRVVDANVDAPDIEVVNPEDYSYTKQIRVVDANVDAPDIEVVTPSNYTRQIRVVDANVDAPDIEAINPENYNYTKQIRVVDANVDAPDIEVVNPNNYTRQIRVVDANVDAPDIEMVNPSSYTRQIRVVDANVDAPDINEEYMQEFLREIRVVDANVDGKENQNNNTETLDHRTWMPNAFYGTSPKISPDTKQTKTPTYTAPTPQNVPTYQGSTKPSPSSDTYQSPRVYEYNKSNSSEESIDRNYNTTPKTYSPKPNRNYYSKPPVKTPDYQYDSTEEQPRSYSKPSKDKVRTYTPSRTKEYKSAPPKRNNSSYQKLSKSSNYQRSEAPKRSIKSSANSSNSSTKQRPSSPKKTSKDD